MRLEMDESGELEGMPTDLVEMLQSGVPVVIFVAEDEEIAERISATVRLLRAQVGEVC